jgi:hypothetical protein
MCRQETGLQRVRSLRSSSITTCPSTQVVTPVTPSLPMVHRQQPCSQASAPGTHLSGEYSLWVSISSLCKSQLINWLCHDRCSQRKQSAHTRIVQGQDKGSLLATVRCNFSAEASCCVRAPPWSGQTPRGQACAAPPAGQSAPRPPPHSLTSVWLAQDVWRAAVCQLSKLAT